MVMLMTTMMMTTMTISLTRTGRIEALLSLGVLAPALAQGIPQRAVSLPAHRASPTGVTTRAPGPPHAPAPTALLIRGAT